MVYNVYDSCNAVYTHYTHEKRETRRSRPRATHSDPRQPATTTKPAERIAIFYYSTSSENCKGAEQGSAFCVYCAYCTHYADYTHYVNKGARENANRFVNDGDAGRDLRRDVPNRRKQKRSGELCRFHRQERQHTEAAVQLRPRIRARLPRTLPQRRHAHHRTKWKNNLLSWRRDPQRRQNAVKPEQIAVRD